MPQRSVRGHTMVFLVAVLIVNVGAVSMAVWNHVHILQAEGAKDVVQRLFSAASLLEHLHTKSSQTTSVNLDSLGNSGQVDVYVGQLASPRLDETNPAAAAIRLLNGLSTSTSSSTVLTMDLATSSPTAAEASTIQLSQNTETRNTKASVYSDVMQRRVHVEELSRPLSYSCPFIALGAGLSMTVVSIVTLMILLQLSNLVAFRFKRAGAVASYIAYTLVPLAFLLGGLAAVSDIQHDCAACERGETLKSSLTFYTEVISALQSLDAPSLPFHQDQKTTTPSVNNVDSIIALVNGVNNFVPEAGGFQSAMILFRADSLGVGAAAEDSGIVLLAPTEEVFTIPDTVAGLLPKSTSGGVSYALSSTSKRKTVVASTFNNAVGMSLSIYREDSIPSNLLAPVHITGPATFGAILILGVALVACITLPVVDLGVRVTSFVHVPPSINVSSLWGVASPARLVLVAICTSIVILSFIRISASVSEFGTDLRDAISSLAYELEVGQGILLRVYDRTSAAMVGASPTGIPDMTAEVTAATSAAFVSVEAAWLESVRSRVAGLTDAFLPVTSFASSFAAGTIVPILQSIATPATVTASANVSEIFMYLLEHEAATLTQLLTQDSRMSACIEANIGGGRSFLPDLTGTSDVLREVQVALSTFDTSVASQRQQLPTSFATLSSLSNLLNTSAAVASRNALLYYAAPSVPKINSALLNKRSKDYSRELTYSTLQINATVIWGIVVIVFLTVLALWDGFFTATFLAPSYPRRARDITTTSVLAVSIAMCCIAAITIGAFGSLNDVMIASATVSNMRHRSDVVPFVADAVLHSLATSKFYSSMSVFPSAVDMIRCAGHQAASVEALDRARSITCDDCRSHLSEMVTIAKDMETVWNAYAQLVGRSRRTSLIPLDDVRALAREAYDIANTTFAWFPETTANGSIIRESYCPNQGFGRNVTLAFPPECGGLVVRAQLVDNYTSMLRSIASLSQTGSNSPLTGSLDYVNIPVGSNGSVPTCPLQVVNRVQRLNSVMRQMYDIVTVSARAMGSATLTDMTVLNTRLQALVKKYTNTAEDLLVLLRAGNYDMSEYFYLAFWMPVLFLWMAAGLTAVYARHQGQALSRSLGFVVASR